MELSITAYTKADGEQAAAVWNEVVLDGMAFPQDAPLTEADRDAFFEGQSFTGVARDAASGQVVGVYILHPNNVGRCGHICNASYAVASGLRGQHIGEQLVRHCLETARTQGFRVLQFNAVVASNGAALALYRKLGFVPLGTIPGGFLNKNGVYEDIIPHFYNLA